MAAWRNAACRALCVAISCAWFAAPALQAQQFAEPSFRAYAVRTGNLEAVEGALKRFLADRIAAGEAIEIIADPAGQRLLVRGTLEVQQLANQFIQATDRPTVEVVAQAPRQVRGYRTATVEELNDRVARLRQAFANRDDVRIAADERLLQIVVHAPADVHERIEASWNQRRATPVPRNNGAPPQGNGFEVVRQQAIPLRNITWQDLLRGLRSLQGPNPAVSSSEDGVLHMRLASATGSTVDLEVNQGNNQVQLSGTEKALQQWVRVVQALDSAPASPNEEQSVGRLGDAQPTTITRTITMLQSAEGGSTPWGGDVVQRMFGAGGREPIRVAQLPDGAAAPQGENQGDSALIYGDSAGSFLGPVRIEFLEGTDIFIVRGQKRDVDRVMKIIEDIERMTVGTQPTIEVIQLQHANSEAVGQLITTLNTGPLSARQGDVSVTALGKPNALLLIGRPAGVEAVKKIIAELDVEVDASTQYRVFHLQFLPAVDAERTIFNLYNALQQAGAATTETNDLKIRVRAVADFRSNSIVVLGSPRDLEEIASLLRQIDVKGSATISEVRVFKLKNALSDEVATVLNDTLGTDQSDQAQQQGGFQQGGGGTGNGNPNTQPYSSRRALMLQMRVLDDEQKKLIDSDLLESGILTNVVVSSNARANSIVVVAPKGSMDLITEIIRQLDELPAQEAEIRVFTIVNGDAQSLIEMLDSLFAQEDQGEGPLIQSAAGTGESTLVPLRFALDARTNSIIASGNPADLVVVQSILLKLDASDVSRRRTTVYELQIQQAQSVATAISTFVLQRRTAIQGIAPETLTAYDLLEQEVVVVAEPDSNKLIISATEQYYDDILAVVRELDKRPDMVMVQCLIASVDLQSAEEFGVELGIQDSLLFNRSVLDENGVPVPGFDFNNQPLGGGLGPGSNRDHVGGQALSNFALGRTAEELGYGGLVLSASNESVSVLVRALQECRRLDVLSRPQVMMLNNTTGEVQVGQQVPYITQSTISGVNIQNSITFQNVGLILSVTPRISRDGLVVLDVLAEKSELSSQVEVPIATTATQVVTTPAIDTTRARTFVTARDGQTVILGGLITKARASTERKVPYLGDVPFFGRLFRYDSIAEERTELLIILTPHIVHDESDVDRVNAEEYARMSWCLGNVIETHGDIGAGGGLIEEEDVVYSRMQPTDAEVIESAPNSGVDTTPLPADWQPIQEGTPSSVPSPGTESDPEGSRNPLPEPTLELGPQAQQPEMRLNTPQNASLFRKFWKRDKKEEPQSPVSAAESVRPVSHLPQPNVKAETKRAVYRFDEVPFFK